MLGRDGRDCWEEKVRRQHVLTRVEGAAEKLSQPRILLTESKKGGTHALPGS